MYNENVMNENAVLFSLSANQQLAERIAAHIGMKLSDRTISRFPSGEILVEPVDTVRGKQVFIIQSTCPPVNENLMETLIFVDALKRSSAKEINLIVPYFGYARQDRKAKPRQPITAALVADLLTTAGVDRVVTINLHAAQIQGFFHCLVDDLTAIPLLGTMIANSIPDKSNITVVSPDHGGVKRARDLAATLGSCPIAIIDKRRASNLEPEVMAIIGSVEGRDCIMVDDIMDTCRSAAFGAEALKKAGAKSVKMAAVHPIFSDPAYELLKGAAFDEVIVTDSVPLQPQFAALSKIKVVSLAGMLGECIERVIQNIPLSAVYEAFAKPENVAKTIAHEK